MAVVEARARMEQTLASGPLMDRSSVDRMVRHQLDKSSLPGEGKNHGASNIDLLAQYRSEQVWKFLELLRSASGNHTENLAMLNNEDESIDGWKLKQDTGQMRVMYREGLEGTPFHTLLAEGLIYSPLVSSLCLGWEAPLYNIWWPQFSMPTFKVSETRWVKRLHVGEDLALVRVKVPWPVATREVVMNCFEVEYFEEDLVLVLIHSVPDKENINEDIHGYTAEDVPDVTPNFVRMDIVGGFALQKVNSEQSYFRTIANLDLKLDFVPPWLINFISRQLIGHGFKLYQKTLTSINNGKGNSSAFLKLMETEPLYSRVKAGLCAREATMNGSLLHERDKAVEFKEASRKEGNMVHTITGKRKAGQAENDIMMISSEIEMEQVKGASFDVDEIGAQDSSSSEEKGGETGSQVSVPIVKEQDGEFPHVGTLDPEVQEAVNMLDKIILYAKSQHSISKKSTTMSQSLGQDNFPAPMLPLSIDDIRGPDDDKVKADHQTEIFARNKTKIMTKSNKRVSCFSFLPRR